MSNYVYYHNPRCSKSRQGIAILSENTIEVDIKEYLKVPLAINQLSRLLKALGLDNAVDMIRPKEPEFMRGDY